MDIRRYDIVQANLSGNIGSEQGGVRPVLVVQNNIGNMRSNTTIIMPLSTALKNINQPTHALIKRGNDNRLHMDSIVLGEQMRVISVQRIIKKIGTVENEEDRKAIRAIYAANFGE